MNWTRIKAILIIFLIAVNLFLGVQLYIRSSGVDSLTRDTVNDTVSLLSEVGITINEQLIPRRNPAIYVYEAEIPSDLNDYYSGAVQKMTGCMADSLRMHMMVNGIRITVRETDDLFEFYSSDLFSFYFCDGEYLDSNEIDGFLKSELDMNEINDTALELRINEELFGLSLRQISEVEAAGFFGVRILRGTQTEDGSYILYCVQQMDGVLIRDRAVTCVMRDGHLIAASGSIIFAKHGAGYMVNYSDAVNVLLTIRADRRASGEDDPTEIIRLSNLYCVNWSQNRRIVYLIPAWEVVYNDQNAQIIDGISCKIRE